MMRINTASFAMLVLSALLWACGQGASDPSPPEDTSASPDVPADGVSASDADDPGPLDGVAPPDGGGLLEDGGEGPPVGLPEETGPGLGMDWEALEAGMAARYDPFSDDWIARGWPNDVLRREDGTLDLSNFPDPGIDLLVSYLEAGSTVLDGWGLNGSVYFQIVGDVDVDALPSTADSTDPLSIIQLVNVSPESPRHGERVPLAFHWYPSGDDPYYAPGTLALRPAFGFPLAEGEVYCAVVTRGITDEDGAHLAPVDDFLEAWETEPTLAPLVAWLTESPLRRGDVAVASCFTTQRATADLRRVRQFLDTMEPAEVAFVSEPLLFGAFHGTYLAPNFQSGEKPYVEEGGALEFDSDGEPIVQATEELRFLMMVPQDQEMPETGWPVVLYAHGTGGDYDSCRGVSDELLGLGYALVCIDQPLHGNRGPEGEEPMDDAELVIYSFNFLNAGSGRTAFRQAAIDSMTLARMVAAGRFDLGASETSSGQPIVLDGGRMTLFGHSHGGLSGALVMGVDPIFEAAVLSGAGGLLINTILLRKDPIDVKALVQTALGIKASHLTSFHPAMSLIQMMVDCTDPVNFAPHWLASGPDASPKHIFVTEGTGDHATPGITTETMTGAGGVPLVVPLANRSATHDLRGIESLSWPVSGNVDTAVGPMTAAVKQWEGESHWVAFNELEARALWRRFFETLHEGVPTLDLGEYLVYTAASLAPGDTCEAASHITGADLPVTVIGNTSLATDDYAAVGCEGAGDGGDTRRDLAWAFTPDVAGLYRFVLTRPLPQKDKDDDPPTGPDRLYVTVDCEDVASGCAQTTDDELIVGLEAGTTVHAIVDGSGLDHRGPFELHIRLYCEDLPCEERVCGAWGCASCGECPSGEICTEDGQCAASGPGDQCESALPLDTAPYIAHGETTGMANDYAFSSDVCPGASTGRGASSSDAVYHFVAPSADRWVFRLDSDFDTALYVVTDCAQIDETCLGGQRRSGKAESLHLELTEGQAVFVIVDGAWNNSNIDGSYTLRIDPCVPDCEGRACGDDGCGQSCGECAVIEICEGETLCDQPFPFSCETTRVCEPRPEGDVCENALVADAVPFEHSGSTVPHHNDFSHGSSVCPGDGSARGGGSPDVVVAFTAPEAALYHFEVSASWDSTLYVVGDCGDVAGSCLGGDQVKKKGGEELYLNLDSGEVVHAIVDGAHSSDKKHGSYTLDIDICVPACGDDVCGSDGCGGSCGGCPKTDRCSGGQCVPKTGNSCEDTIKIGSPEWDHDEDTGNFDPTLSAALCQDAPIQSGLNSADVVYRFTPAVDATYRFTLDAEFDGALYALAECGDDGACLGWATDELSLELTKDVTIYVVVDGAGAEVSAGDYELEVTVVCFPDCEGRTCGDDGCGQSCGTCVAPADLCQVDEGVCASPDALPGNTCAAPFEVDLTTLPFIGAGDTDEALNHYGVGDGDCAGFVGMGQGSSEQVWRLTADEAGDYVVDLAGYGFDPVLYAVTDCADLQSTCIALSDTRHGEQLVLTLDAAQTVFLMVDGTANYENVSGTYELRVDR